MNSQFMRSLSMKRITILFISLIGSTLLFADEHPVKQHLLKYEEEAEMPLVSERGKTLWEKKGADGETSCATCHNKDVTKPGSHKVLGLNKKIEPMALSESPKLYKSWKKTDRHFDKFCKKTFDRKCTAQEKGDMLLYLSEQ